MKNMSESQAMRCLQDTLFVIGGKWKLEILRAMSDGCYRFKDIQRKILPITTRVLSNELKHLEENQLIVRTVFDSPSAIEYRLSKYTNTLLPVVEAMIVWGDNHRKKLLNQ